MKIHIFTKESNYSFTFLEFFEENFNTADSIFIFRSKAGKFNYSSKLRSRLRFYDTPGKMIIHAFPKVVKSDEIFFHYFPVGPSLYFWFVCLPLLKRKKVNWNLWGGDLYFYLSKKSSLKNYAFEWIRSKLIKQVDRIICPVKGDFELAKKVYNTHAEYYYAFYPALFDHSQLDHLLQSNREPGKKKVIMLGNSADPANRHLELLEWLRPFRDERIRIICPLSYGSKENAEHVMKIATEIYKEKFVPITNYLSQEEYANLLSTVDVAIMNHRRQQGLGNIFTLLYLKKKVYIRSDVSSFEFFQDIGIHIFDSLSISEESFSELLKFESSQAASNYQLVKNETSMQNLLKIWGDVIAD